MSSWFSDSDAEEEFVPAVLRRPKVANHLVHESFAVDMRDHEDHSFCGVMFDVCCRGEADLGVPLDFMQIEAISVRGELGPLTVWSTPGSFKGKEHHQDAWTLLYEGEHPPSMRSYRQLPLTAPIVMRPGQRCGIYVHSKLRGDDAIIYDNQRGHVTYEDAVFRVLPGLAHLSNKPFGRSGMWGVPWRENREFVGRFEYGVSYKLWNPEVHRDFPEDFRKVVKTVLLCGRRLHSPLHSLQDEVLFYILNMCKHDWFRTGASAIVAPQPPGDIGGNSLAGLLGQVHCPGFVRSSMVRAMPGRASALGGGLPSWAVGGFRPSSSSDSVAEGSNSFEFSSPRSAQSGGASSDDGMDLLR
mmetsp:Transcript_21383/g.47365  ORF Transcript_21383/g.47365 Transcript_21383/m.47365 type:complete len:356 (+) Transcript_21383:157-1224(+)